MTLGQMKAVTEYASAAIDNFAAGNEAFDRDREGWRQNLSVQGAELGVSLTAFEFRLRTEHYTIVLNNDNEIVHAEVDRKR